MKDRVYNKEKNVYNIVSDFSAAPEAIRTGRTETESPDNIFCVGYPHGTRTEVHYES